MAYPTIFYANTLEDVFYQLKTVNGLHITGGCSTLEPLPEKMLSIRGIIALEEIEKHERFIEFGSAVTLSRIAELKDTRLPSVLYEAVSTVANRHVRNLATIGGNICAQGIKHTLYAPLLALDARLEFQRDTTSTNFIPFSKFTRVSDGWLLSKIRVPVEEWDVAVFRRLGPSHIITETSASFAFLANSQNGMLAALRIAFAGLFTFRSPELENRLIGAHLPLSSGSVKDLINEAAKQFDAAVEGISYNPILRSQFLNLLKYSLEQLT
ncbi:MAG: FAD binding domain-containing protein [Treponema sp.]|nr:FAD binding domain-containing protein [Treponema sp.]